MNVENVATFDTASTVLSKALGKIAGITGENPDLQALLRNPAFTDAMQAASGAFLETLTPTTAQTMYEFISSFFNKHTPLLRHFFSDPTFREKIGEISPELLAIIKGEA